MLADIGRNIAEIRRKRGMTQEQFAQDVATVGVKYLQKLESGRANLTMDSLVTLATKLGVDVVALLRVPADRSVKIGRPAKRQ